MDALNSAGAAIAVSANATGLPASGQPYASLEDMQAWAEGVMARAPDLIIGEPARPYLRRWWVVPRNYAANTYLHEILRSDDDRAGHDHPWPNASYVIFSGYEEVIYDPLQPWIEVDRVWRGPGSFVARKATDTHRLIVPDGGRCISLFTTAARERDWGFWCPDGKGWVHWRDFTGGDAGEIVGRGCGEADHG